MDALLTEAGDDLLTEAGDVLLLESASESTPPGGQVPYATSMRRRRLMRGSGR